MYMQNIVYIYEVLFTLFFTSVFPVYCLVLYVVGEKGRGDY